MQFSSARLNMHKTKKKNKNGERANKNTFRTEIDDENGKNSYPHENNDSWMLEYERYKNVLSILQRIKKDEMKELH